MKRGDIVASKFVIAGIIMLSLLFALAYRQNVESLLQHVDTKDFSGFDTRAVSPTPSLELSPTIDTTRENQSKTFNDAEFQPTMLWPAVLFTIAFLCGWLVRHLLRVPQVNELLSESVLELDLGPASNDKTVSSDIRQGEQRVVELNQRIANLQQEIGDIPQHEYAPEKGGSNTVEIKILRKKNIAKAEIIKALEDLVDENREKWLNRDEMEASMNQRIKELTDDLNAAMVLVHEWKSDKDDAEQNTEELSQPHTSSGNAA